MTCFYFLLSKFDNKFFFKKNKGIKYFSYSQDFFQFKYIPKMDELGDKHFSQIINFKEVKKRTMNNQRIIIRD